MYGDSAPPSWARLPGARCRAVEHLTKLEGLQEFEILTGLEESFFQALAIASAVLEMGVLCTGRGSLQERSTLCARGG